MAQTTCFETFRGNAPRLTLARFCESFGPYPWVRLVGLQEILNALTARGRFPSVLSLQALIRKELKTAATGLAMEGEDLFPKGDWSSCNVTQLNLALASKPMCIEKAIIVARATERACQKATKQFRVPDVDVCRHLSIHASNCIVEGLDEWTACQRWPRRFFADELGFLDGLEKKLRPYTRQLQLRHKGDTLAASRPNGFDKHYDFDQFILAVMNGEAITWKNAQLLKAAFDTALGTETKIKVLPARAGETGLHACSEFEAPFIGLTLEELNALRGDLNKQPLSAQRGAPKG